MEKDRAKTDQSLGAERKGADEMVVDTAVAEFAADKVVEAARHEADAVLAIARGKADRVAEPSNATAQSIVEEDRALADDLVVAERAAADDRLKTEREEGRQALAALLPLEREKTDRNLLTERARSDEAIANRDDFLAIVSHDLRNLLGGIVLSSGLLSKRASATDEGKRITETGKRIELYGARMNRLIGDLVDVASIDAGKLACAIALHDPRTLIAETLATFRAPAEAKGILLNASTTGILPFAAFDHERMLQVFANLVSNALKFTAHGGEVNILGAREKEEVHFSVGDTGQGIPESMLDSVFLRFWQSKADDRRGSGLGLYISKCLVEAQRGRIWVESKVREGSVFHFTVPLATQVQASRPQI